MRRSILLPVAALAALFLLLSSGGCDDTTGGVAAPPAYQKVLLDRFPVSLDVLFKTGDPTRRNQILTGIRSGRPESTTLFLVPYPNYTHDSHFPATLKWYLYTGGHTAVSIPLASFLDVSGDAGKSTQTIDGTVCVVDIKATLHLNYYIRIQLDHVCITQDLVNRFHGAAGIDVFGRTLPAVAVAANTVVGFSHASYALDFIVEDDTCRNFDLKAGNSYAQHLVNPYFYFTASAQTQIRTYYQAQLDAMKASGLFPESHLDRAFDINEPHTLFGSWYYHEGYFQLTSAHHPYGWYSFDGAVLNLLDVDKTDRDTFYKDAATGSNFGSTMIGLFCDAAYPGDVPDYEVIGGRYMVRLSGDDRQGIVRLDRFFSGTRTGTVYLKFQFTEGIEATPWDDQLVVDYFSTLAAAQGAFSSKKLTYLRLFERTD